MVNIVFKLPIYSTCLFIADMFVVNSIISKVFSQHGYKCKPEEHEPFCVSDTQRIKVIVPDGTICLVTSKNKHVIQWKYQVRTRA